MKHGLRAEVLPLPNEDPAVVAARAAEWNDYYKPQSPGAQHLVNACVRATILSDRVASYHDFTVGKQVREAKPLWDRTRENEALQIFSQLESDPYETVRLLKQTGHGCDLLIREWEKLKAALDDVGRWSATELDHMIMLLGERPGLTNLSRFPKGYMACFLNSVLWGEHGIVWLEALCDPTRVPDSLASVVRRDALPDEDEARAGLLDMTLRMIEELTDLLVNTLDPIEFPDRDEAEGRSTILVDEKSARLFLRYHAEARNAFHKAYGQLVKALDRDAEHCPNEAKPEREGEAPAEPQPKFGSAGASPSRMESTTTARGNVAPEDSPNEAKPAVTGWANAKIFKNQSEDEISFLRNEPTEVRKRVVDFSKPVTAFLLVLLLILGSGIYADSSEIKAFPLVKPQADRPRPGTPGRGRGEGFWTNLEPRYTSRAIRIRLSGSFALPFRMSHHKPRRVYKVYFASHQNSAQRELRPPIQNVSP